MISLKLFFLLNVPEVDCWYGTLSKKMQVFAFLTVMLLQLQTIAVWQVYRLLRQRSQSQRRGLLLQEFPVCQKTFCSLLGVGKKRFERLRQAAVKEEPCPVDERFRPKHHEFLAPGSMRPTVYEWLEKCI